MRKLGEKKESVLIIMNENDKKERKDRITKKLHFDKNKPVAVLAWQHAVMNSVKSTLLYCKNATEEFACITKIGEREFVTIPFSLYIKLLKTYKSDEIDEEL